MHLRYVPKNGEVRLVEDIIGEIGRSDSLEFRNGELQIQNPVDLQSMRFIPEQT